MDRVCCIVQYVIDEAFSIHDFLRERVGHCGALAVKRAPDQFIFISFVSKRTANKTARRIGMLSGLYLMLNCIALSTIITAMKVMD